MSNSDQDKKTHVHFLVTRDGNCQAVQLSMTLWDLVEKHVLAAAKRLDGDIDPFSRPQPLNHLADLKTYWDFTYPYEPHVHCDHCQASSDNWEEDLAHPFHLTNANIAGLLVFRCRCGATVRKKHFHRKVVFECSPPNQRP